MELGIALILVAAVLLVVGLVLRRNRPSKEELARVKDQARPASKPDDLAHLRPPVKSMHVRDDEVRLTFDVPVPDEEDDVLSEYLVAEAIEYVREKQHELPMSQVNHVVVLGGRDEEREIGRASLEEPGMLPPRSEAIAILNLATIAPDPLEAEFDESVTVPETRAMERRDELPPLTEEIQIPKAVEVGLRAQGIDPKTMSAGQLFTGMLGLFGYRVNQMSGDTYLAEKGGSRTFIRTSDYQAGGYPEIDEPEIRKFVVDFGGSGADRGLFVTEKYGAFAMHDVERRDPRTRFVVRERLQRTIDYLALG